MTLTSNQASDPVESPVGSGRHYLTLLFSDLSGSTRLAHEMEAEHYAAVLATVRGAYQDTIRQHGGLIVRVQGDGLLAMFGYPRAREDDGRRAVDAALDLHDKVKLLRPVGPELTDISLSLHTGIHSGLVLVEAGDIERGRFELLGPVPNIAAHLSNVAGPHEILVSEETLGPASHFFTTEQPRRVLVKKGGISLHVFSVQARADVATRFEARARRGLAPFVGRRLELDVLESHLGDVIAGRSRSVALCAVPGLGKTRLAEEFLLRAAQRHCQIYRGYCESYLSAEPLQPFLQMLRTIFRLAHGTSAQDAAASVDAILGQIDPALLVHRAEYLRALSLGETKHPAAEQMSGALRDLFSVLAARQPLVMFIDDWQWADDASNQALAAIRDLGDRALLVVLATRAIKRDDIPATVSVLVLEPLTPVEAAETIGQLLPGVDPFVATEISRYSGGNPLFIEELCHDAAHDDTPLRPKSMHGAAAWLNQLVESRVQRLPAAQAEIVRAAAVIGNVVPVWLLERITGCKEDDPLVRGLAEQDFVFPGESPGTLRFKHGITRDVIYNLVGFKTRQAMHLRTAEALLQQGAVAAPEEAYEALAYHFAAGGGALQAAHYAELAADKAVAASALDRAKTQYRAALSALDRLAPTLELSRRWISVAQRMGLVCVFDASRSDLAIFERAVALATKIGDAGAIARSTYWLGFISYSLGEAKTAIGHCELALELAQRVGDEPLAVQILATLGQAHTATSNYDRALELLDNAIAVKRRHRSGRRTTVGLAYALVCRGCVFGDRGQFALAYECFEEAMAGLMGVTHEIGTTIYGWRGAVLLWQGQWEGARLAAAESARSAELTRSLFQLSVARALGGYADWMIDGQARALQTVADATGWLRPREGGLFQSLNHGWLADGFVSLGRGPNARHHAALALLRGRKRDIIGVAMAYRALARMAAQAGNLAASDRYIALALMVSRVRGSQHEIAVTRLCEAGIAWAHQDGPRVAVLLDQAMPAFEAMGMSWHLGEAARLRSLASSQAG